MSSSCLNEQFYEGQNKLTECTICSEYKVGVSGLSLSKV